MTGGDNLPVVADFRLKSDFAKNASYLGRTDYTNDIKEGVLHLYTWVTFPAKQLSN